MFAFQRLISSECKLCIQSEACSPINWIQRSSVKKKKASQKALAESSPGKKSQYERSAWLALNFSFRKELNSNVNNLAKRETQPSELSTRYVDLNTLQEVKDRLFSCSSNQILSFTLKCSFERIWRLPSWRLRLEVQVTNLSVLSRFEISCVTF